jgi:integrase
MKGFVSWLLRWWADRTLSDVRRNTCEAYVKYRTAQPIRHGTTGRKASIQTARRELEVLSAAIGYWDDEHHLTRRPKVILPEKPESSRDALTRSEAASLLWASLGHRKHEDGWLSLSGSSKANRQHLRRFILIGLYTGSRAGVIKRLSWTESLQDPWVDLDAGIIYRRGRNERDSKTKRRPLVKLPKKLIAHLRRWKKQDAEKGAATVLHHGGQPVASVRTGFSTCVADAGLKDVTPHWLRHTSATWLMEAGVDLWTASGYLGMSGQTLEKHYGHHRPDHQSAARKAFA